MHVTSNQSPRPSDDENADSETASPSLTTQHCHPWQMQIQKQWPACWNQKNYDDSASESFMMVYSAHDQAIP
jgi:hypothetical protein